MDYKQIKAAIAVAETGSFSLAGMRLSYSVSAISKQIANLENEMGIRLFERSANSKVILTSAGEMLIPYFKRAYDVYAEMYDCIETNIRSKSDILTIGSVYRRLGASGFEAILSDFMSKYPDIRVVWTQDSEANLFENVLSHKLDISTVGRINNNLCENFDKIIQSSVDVHSIQSGQVNYLDYLTCELMMALPSSHSNISNGKVSLKALKNEKFLFMSVNSEYEQIGHRYFRAACLTEGFEPKMERFNVANRDFIMEMVAKGVGVAPVFIMPLSLYSGVTICNLDRSYYSLTNSFCYRKDNASPALKEFIRFVKNRKE